MLEDARGKRKKGKKKSYHLVYMNHISEMTIGNPFIYLFSGKAEDLAFFSSTSRSQEGGFTLASVSRQLLTSRSFVLIGKPHFFSFQSSCVCKRHARLYEIRSLCSVIQQYTSSAPRCMKQIKSNLSGAVPLYGQSDDQEKSLFIYSWLLNGLRVQGATC